MPRPNTAKTGVHQTVMVALRRRGSRGSQKTFEFHRVPYLIPFHWSRELLLTSGMGLDRAPDEILTFIFSPFEMRPPNSAAVLRTRPLYGFDGSKVESVQLQFI